MTVIPVEKIEDRENCVPTIWRAPLSNIVDHFVIGSKIDAFDHVSIKQADEDTIRISSSNIEDYPDRIGEMSQETWRTSVYLWQETHWDVIVDLITSSGDVSDLSFHATVHETETGYLIKPGLIYVP